MGTGISVENRTGNGIMVECWTKGKGFKVGEWGIGAKKEGSRKFEAVWYDVCITAGDRREWIAVYGGNQGGSNLFWDGNKLGFR